MRRLAFFALALMAACSSRPSGGEEAKPPAPIDPFAPLGEGPEPVLVDLAPSCGELGDAPLSFTDETTKWALDLGSLAVVGSQIAAADLDGDGYPDLVVHSYHNPRSDPSLPGNQQSVRVLMNRPREGGGRKFVEATLPSGYGAIRDGAKPAEGKLRMAHMTVAGDVDGDGDLDLFSGVYVDPNAKDQDTGDRNDILLNDGKGKFTLAPKSAVQSLAGDVPTKGATFVDVDHDGILDVFVVYWYRGGSATLGVQARLFKGKGDGTFVDATPGSGLETEPGGYTTGRNHRPAFGATACDLDDDGLPELLVSAYGRQWNLLYKNMGGLKFTEMGQASAYAGDSVLDYTDNQMYQCHCYKTGSCDSESPVIDCSSAQWSTADSKPWMLNGNTFATVCADLNGDGKLDLYNAEIAHWWAGKSSDPSQLLVNDGPQEGAPIHFVRPGREATGLVWPHRIPNWDEGGITAASADLDLDGAEDILVGDSEYMDNFALVYRQKSPGLFEEIAEKIGLRHPCAVALAIADFDRDGDLDVVVGSGNWRGCGKKWPNGPEVHFYENKQNDGAKKRGWLQIALEGKGAGFASKSAYGARVKVVSNGRVITKELQGGYGHGDFNDTVLTFGLGDSCVAEGIEVRWPNNNLTKTRFKNVGGGRRILLREDGSFTELKK